MCCSVVQCVAVCCSVVQCVTVCCSVLQCVAVCCSVLQGVTHSCLGVPEHLRGGLGMKVGSVGELCVSRASHICMSVGCVCCLCEFGCMCPRYVYISVESADEVVLASQFVCVGCVVRNVKCVAAGCVSE